MFRFLFILVVIILLVAAFAGIQPFSDWKDTAFNQVSEWWQDLFDSTDNVTATGTQAVVATTTTSTAVIPSYTTSQTIEADDFAVIFNEYRQSKGRSPLVFTDDLNRVASLRLAEIKINFSHYSPGQYNLHLGENIVEGIYSDQRAFECWQGSPGHNANMLDPEYICTGYAIGDGHAVQVFSFYITINGVPQIPEGWYWTD